MGNRWFVIQTVPGQERLAEKCVKHLGFEIYQPKRESGAFDGRSPLFPGYLFVAFDLMDASWGRIVHAIGVLCILGTNRLEIGEHMPPPIPLPEGFIESMKVYMDALGGFMPSPKAGSLPPLNPGERVAVTQGPFSGFEALVQASEGERVKILLDIFGSLRPILITRESLALKNGSTG